MKENTDANIDILCVGNAIVDIFVQTDAALLEKYGITETTQHIEHEKVVDILKNFPNYTAVSGGGAANVAKIAAFLGVNAAFIGAAGQDELSRVFESSLMDAGVRLFLLRTDKPTGLCVFLQRPKERTRIVAAPSASYLLTADDVSEESLQAARLVVIDGFILDRIELVRRIFTLAGKYGTVIGLDIGSVGMAQAHAKEVVQYCSEYPLILFMNQDEAAAFYQTIHNDLDAEEDAALLEKIKSRVSPFNRKIQAYFQKLTHADIFPIIVVKLGAKGAMVFSGGKAHYEPTLAIIPHDPTGAGDVFCAAFLSAWLRGKSFADCTAFGNKVAREALNANGTLMDWNKLKALSKGAVSTSRAL
ncbi:MAG: adenosine kinase [Treponema sp.]|jgi:sugar/nucleoside kinase (ribokinase family)|nr:adenosine kinase [Treponema sp.]